jgi:Lon protease-like protein
MDHSIHTAGFGNSVPGTIQVPDVIPIFPLTSTVLLPGEVLPLHIFEPRYRAMVRDALATHKVIGMVQALPASPTEDIGEARVCEVGCIGLIAQHEELPDGRFLMWLLGLERFQIDQELFAATAYRQVRVHYTPVEASALRLAGIQPLRQELRSMLPRLVDADESTQALLRRQMEEVSDTQLIALACQILELGADRKQAILEAASQTDRFLMVYEDVYRHLDQHPHDEALQPTVLN